MVSDYGDRKSPGAIPIPNGLLMVFQGVILTTYDTWDDPPSKGGGRCSRGAQSFSMAVFHSLRLRVPSCPLCFSYGYSQPTAP